MRLISKKGIALTIILLFIINSLIIAINTDPITQFVNNIGISHKEYDLIQIDQTSDQQGGMYISVDNETEPIDNSNNCNIMHIDTSLIITKITNQTQYCNFYVISKNIIILYDGRFSGEFDGNETITRDFDFEIIMNGAYSSISSNFTYKVQSDFDSTGRIAGNSYIENQILYIPFIMDIGEIIRYTMIGINLNTEIINVYEFTNNTKTNIEGVDSFYYRTDNKVKFVEQSSEGVVEYWIERGNILSKKITETQEITSCVQDSDCYYNDNLGGTIQIERNDNELSISTNGKSTSVRSKQGFEFRVSENLVTERSIAYYELNSLNYDVSSYHYVTTMDETVLVTHKIESNYSEYNYISYDFVNSRDNSYFVLYREYDEENHHILNRFTVLRINLDQINQITNVGKNYWKFTIPSSVLIIMVMIILYKNSGKSMVQELYPK